MKIVKTKRELVGILADFRRAGKSIGFVPTMGALHPGHLSLISYSKAAADVTVCSIFVNPTQFNNKTDLEKYPRMPGKDAAMLETAGCDVLFMPPTEEVYPEGYNATFHFGYLETILEGAHRPGHFNGVGQVVSILFEIVRPDKAFFGLKDYQQVMVIRDLIRQLRLNIEIVACPILREPDGLAMSSRNMLLSPDERAAAALIPKLMEEAVQLKKEGLPLKDIELKIAAELGKNPIYRLDYFSICNADTLEPAETFVPDIRYIALIACFVGKIRLIDNIMLF
ncbi:MAG: pantoate--beta-alanine ligase [Bacteroidia bacterium]